MNKKVIIFLISIIVIIFIILFCKSVLFKVQENEDIYLVEQEGNLYKVVNNSELSTFDIEVFQNPYLIVCQGIFASMQFRTPAMQ